MKILILFLSVMFWVHTSYAQVQFQDTTTAEETVVPKAKIDKSKLYYGGNVNLSIGNYTVIGATPLVGYKVSPQFSVGGQLAYEYVRDRRYSTDYETSNYGLSIFSRYRVVPQLYVHAEFSEMNYKLYNNLGGSERTWVPFLWLGGGFSQPISRNTWLNAQVLFDVINNENSPYKDWEPFYSIGFGVGF